MGGGRLAHDKQSQFHSRRRIPFFEGDFFFSVTVGPGLMGLLLEPAVCLVYSYWPPGGHMVVGRQPHGGQNEQKMKK